MYGEMKTQGTDGKMSEGLNNTKGVAVRETSAAERLVELVDRVQIRADKAAALTGDKLKPIMRTSGPTGKLETQDKCPIEYPPLFEVLRQKIQSIDNSLDLIFDCITRTAL